MAGGGGGGGGVTVIQKPISSLLPTLTINEYVTLYCNKQGVIIP